MNTEYSSLSRSHSLTSSPHVSSRRGTIDQEAINNAVVDPTVLEKLIEEKGNSHLVLHEKNLTLVDESTSEGASLMLKIGLQLKVVKKQGLFVLINEINKISQQNSFKGLILVSNLLNSKWGLKQLSSSNNLISSSNNLKKPKKKQLFIDIYKNNIAQLVQELRNIYLFQFSKQSSKSIDGYSKNEDNGFSVIRRKFSWKRFNLILANEFKSVIIKSNSANGRVFNIKTIVKVAIGCYEDKNFAAVRMFMKDVLEAPSLQSLKWSLNKTKIRNNKKFLKMEKLVSTPPIILSETKTKKPKEHAETKTKMPKKPEEVVSVSINPVHKPKSVLLDSVLLEPALVGLDPFMLAFEKHFKRKSNQLALNYLKEFCIPGAIEELKWKLKTISADPVQIFFKTSEKQLHPQVVAQFKASDDYKNLERAGTKELNQEKATAVETVEAEFLENNQLLLKNVKSILLKNKADVNEVIWFKFTYELKKLIKQIYFIENLSLYFEVENPKKMEEIRSKCFKRLVKKSAIYLETRKDIIASMESEIKKLEESKIKTKVTELEESKVKTTIAELEKSDNNSERTTVVQIDATDSKDEINDHFINHLKETIAAINALPLMTERDQPGVDEEIDKLVPQELNLQLPTLIKEKLFFFLKTEMSGKENSFNEDTSMFIEEQIALFLNKKLSQIQETSLTSLTLNLPKIRQSIIVLLKEELVELKEENNRDEIKTQFIDFFIKILQQPNSITPQSKMDETFSNLSKILKLEGLVKKQLQDFLKEGLLNYKLFLQVKKQQEDDKLKKQQEETKKTQKKSKVEKSQKKSKEQVPQEEFYSFKSEIKSILTSLEKQALVFLNKKFGQKYKTHSPLTDLTKNQIYFQNLVERNEFTTKVNHQSIEEKEIMSLLINKDLELLEACKNDFSNERSLASLDSDHHLIQLAKKLSTNSNEDTADLEKISAKFKELSDATKSLVKSLKLEGFSLFIESLIKDKDLDKRALEENETELLTLATQLENAVTYEWDA